MSQDEALVRARRELGEFRDVFEGATLPASIEVRLRPGLRDPATVRSVARRVSTFAFVDDIRYGEEWIQKLYRLRTVAGIAGLVLGLTFATVSVIIIGATIRMAVLARAKAAGMVVKTGFVGAPGAGPNALAAPQAGLISSLAKGVMGGLLALLLTWLARLLIDRYIIETVFFDERLAALGLLFGAMIGLVGSAVSVGRHLRSV